MVSALWTPWESNHDVGTVVRRKKSNNCSDESDKNLLKSFFPWKPENTGLGAKFESWWKIETRRIQKKWHIGRNSYDWYYKIPKVSPVTDGWVSQETCSAEENPEKSGSGCKSQIRCAKMSTGKLYRLPMESCRAISGGINHGGLFWGCWGL